MELPRRLCLDFSIWLTGLRLIYPFEVVSLELIVQNHPLYSAALALESSLLMEVGAVKKNIVLKFSRLHYSPMKFLSAGAPRSHKGVAFLRQCMNPLKTSATSAKGNII